MHDGDSTDVVVVGGGLAGLTAATILARAGRRVRLFEKARELGGRARTLQRDGFAFNLGPHAVFRRGATWRVLAGLGVAIDAGRVPASGYAVHAGVAHTLPAGPASLLTSGLLGPAGKLQVARLLGSLEQVDPGTLQHVSVDHWLDQHRLGGTARAFATALVRLATYAHAPGRLSAGAAVERLRLGGGGVFYLNGGWQTLVDGLRRRALEAGVQIASHAPVVALERGRGLSASSEGGLRGARLSDGTRVSAPAAVIAAGPADAAALVEGDRDGALARWAATREPLRAACLDVALRRLPRPRATFALGVDRPLYFSVHSAVARLAPADGALVHLARYLGAEPSRDGRADEAEFEALLDLLQPGWRDEVVHRRFLPDMLVAHALPSAAEGGTTRRPGPDVPGIAGLYVAGDWVGPEGLLADASVASAALTAERLLALASGRHAAGAAA